MKYARRQNLLAVIMAVLFGVFSIAVAAANDTGKLPDSMIKTLIEHRLVSQHLGDQDINVAVNNGDVTLTGTVQSLAQKNAARDVAESVDDVNNVTDNLTISVPARTDQEIANDVAKSIRRYVFYDVFDWVQGTVKNGVVTLDGWARVPWHKVDYGRRAAAVTGVREVINNIKVLPVSTFDDQIRIAAARIIYNNPDFLQYANRVDPPIHIIVDNGRIILKGEVESKVDKVLAANLLRTSLMTFGVTNDLTVNKS